MKFKAYIGWPAPEFILSSRKKVFTLECKQIFPGRRGEIAWVFTTLGGKQMVLGWIRPETYSPYTITSISHMFSIQSSFN